MKKLSKQFLTALFFLIFAVAMTFGACETRPTTSSSESSSQQHEHIASEWIIDSTATCTENGSKHRECTICHEILETEEITAAHSYDPDNSVITIAEDGSSAAITGECTVCHTQQQSQPYCGTYVRGTEGFKFNALGVRENLVASFLEFRGNTYYVINNILVTNYYIIDDKVFDFGDDGIKRDTVFDKVYVVIGGNTYYVINNIIVKNYFIIDGKVIDFGDDGVKRDTVLDKIIITISGDRYYVINNLIQFGYQLVGDNVYDFGTDGKQKSEPLNKLYVVIGGNTYYVVNNVIVKNYYIVNDHVIDFGDDGVKRDTVLDKRYIIIGGNTYYVINNIIVKNYFIIDGKVIDFGDDGVKRDTVLDKIIITISGDRYYVINNLIQFGYQLVGDNVYDFGTDGKQKSEPLNKLYVVIGGNTYYVINNIIVKNYYIIDDEVIDFGDDGVKRDTVLDKRYVIIGGNTYYVINNIIVKNYYIINDEVIDFGDDGVKRDTVLDKRYIIIGSNTYYVINNIIVKNYFIIDGKVIDFGDDGVKRDTTLDKTIVKVGNDNYYVKNNVIQTGNQLVGDKIYDFGTDGKQKDTVFDREIVVIGNNKYYAIRGTIVVRTYVFVINHIYYFGDDGCALIGTTFGSYEFGDDGFITGSDIYIEIDGTLYEINDGIAKVHEHNYIDTVVEPTCVKNGYTLHTCACGAEYKDNITKAYGHNYVSGVCTICGAKDPDYNEPTPGDGTYRIEGNYIYFGTYPQTDVTASMGTTLASYVSDLPSNGNNNGWTSYNYYISNSNETDFMWYKDVTYSDGSKYRAVYFTSYRPSRTTNSGSPFWQDDNGYKTNNVYWFRFDEIKWKILEKTGNTATILAELILDSQDYNHTENNNYENSSIRAWLNDTFYNTAFNSLQKALINTVEVDNSARSTNPNNDSTKWNRGTNKYACANTQDKVWLLSQQDVTRVAYGFNSDPYNYDMARRKQTTAYAQSQGIWKSAEIDYRGNGCWWLRSPFYYFRYDAQIVNFTGYSASINLDIIAISTHRGVVPALQMTLSNEEHKHTESEWIVDNSATCTLSGSMHKECTVCGETLAIQEIHALEHNYVSGVCTICGAKDPDYNEPAPSDETYRIDGDYIYFGRYPQTDVTASMGTTLASYVSAKPANDNNNGWTSYKYYINSGNTTDYMWYKDVTYTDGNKYRAVYFTSYRPYWTGYSSSTDNTWQDDNGYTLSNVYWFRFDEIKWRILNRTGNTATILAELILDSQDYNYTNNSSNGYYANNYANSSIRKWLNETFYNVAFNSLQKALINTVTVDNSARSTNPDNNATYLNSGTNQCACDNTQDKVWLLSKQEVTRASYGFNTSLDTDDTIRRKQASAYAQCQGTYVYRSIDSVYNGNSYWWLRSPDYDCDDRAWFVDYGGYSTSHDSVRSTNLGVVPALQISLG